MIPLKDVSNEHGQVVVPPNYCDTILGTTNEHGMYIYLQCKPCVRALFQMLLQCDRHEFEVKLQT